MKRNLIRGFDVCPASQIDIRALESALLRISRSCRSCCGSPSLFCGKGPRRALHCRRGPRLCRKEESRWRSAQYLILRAKPRIFETFAAKPRAACAQHDGDEPNTRFGMVARSSFRSEGRGRASRDCVASRSLRLSSDKRVLRRSGLEPITPDRHLPQIAWRAIE